MALFKDRSRTIHLDCGCHVPEHIVRISYFEWDHGGPEFYISVQANMYLPWYKRIWPSIKYMFGYPGLMWDETLIEPKDVDQLEKVIKEFKQKVKEHEKKNA